MIRTTVCPSVLELAQLLEHDRVAEVDVGGGRVEAELDPQRPAFGEPLLERALTGRQSTALRARWAAVRAASGAVSAIRPNARVAARPQASA